MLVSHQTLKKIHSPSEQKKDKLNTMFWIFKILLEVTNLETTTDARIATSDNFNYQPSHQEVDPELGPKLKDINFKGPIIHVPQPVYPSVPSASPCETRA